MEYLQYAPNTYDDDYIREVLNLIINGIPSILRLHQNLETCFLSFKPYYKWNTFNTIATGKDIIFQSYVLNLIINGIPSIQERT